MEQKVVHEGLFQLVDEELFDVGLEVCLVFEVQKQIELVTHVLVVFFVLLVHCQRRPLGEELPHRVVLVVGKAYQFFLEIEQLFKRINELELSAGYVIDAEQVTFLKVS